jgi:hypothetical protein
MQSTRTREYNAGALSTTGAHFGALNIRAGAAGVGFPIGVPAAGDTEDALGSIPGSYADHCRLIGVAFEVENTTSPMYRQGAVTVGMLCDVSSDPDAIVFSDTTAANAPCTKQADWTPLYAGVVSDLVAVPTSATWPAAEGCYVTPKLTFTPPTVDKAPYCQRVPVAASSQNQYSYYTTEPIGATTTGTLKYPTHYGVWQSGFSPVEAYFTGLSAETTLTVRFRTIVEYFPDLKSTLLPSATPSPPFDPVALALVSAVSQRIPYAVMLKENGWGDFFKRVLQVIGVIAPVIAPLTGPFAPLVMAGGGAAAAGSALIKGQKLNEEKIRRAADRVASASQKVEEIARNVAGMASKPTKR